MCNVCKRVQSNIYDLCFGKKKNTFFRYDLLSTINGLIHIMHLRDMDTWPPKQCRCFVVIFFLLLLQFSFLNNKSFIKIGYLNACWFHLLFSPCLISFDPSWLHSHFPYKFYFFFICFFFLCELEFILVAEFISLIHSSNIKYDSWEKSTSNENYVLRDKQVSHLYSFLAWFAQIN